MKRLDISRHIPMGMDAEKELRWPKTALILGALLSLGFFFNYGTPYRELFYTVGREKLLLSGAVMPDFAVILDSHLLFLAVAALMSLLDIVRNYAHHWSGGSKSIYLMRRLPNRWELHRRCLTLPIAAALMCLLCAFILLLIYYAFYMLRTPAECLTPDQWGKLWHMWIGV